MQQRWNRAVAPPSTRLFNVAMGALGALALCLRLPAGAAAATAPDAAASSPAAAAASAVDAAASTADQNAALQLAIRDLRNVGTAMFGWYAAEMAPRRTHRTDGKPPAPTAVDVTRVPLISYQSLQSLLVPKYLKSLPRTDPWGGAYEYRLNTQDPDARQTMVIRTGGADRRFAADTYTIGPFAASDRSQNLVWADGYFARWPVTAANYRELGRLHPGSQLVIELVANGTDCIDAPFPPLTPRPQRPLLHL